MKNSNFKKLLTNIYALLPLFLLKKTFLIKYIHHKGIPKTVISFLVADSDIRMIAADSPIVKILYWMGINGYEASENKLWEDLCKNSKKTVEIGGNIGFYTILGAKSNPTGKYIVYEPVPYNFDVLQKNIELNGLENIVAVNAAVTSGQTKKTRLYLPAQESSYSAPTGGYIENSEIKLEEYMSIEVDCVSSLEAISGCDLIKIDAEGAEFEILSSAKEVIALERPVILLELLEGSINLKNLIVEFIESFNYSAAVLSYQGAWTKLSYNDILQVSMVAMFGCRDIVLYPSENKNLNQYSFH